ncbi:hypothetical protein BDQ12DRAFT_733035 [Crucibulum laeve]|uniref:NACHT domain-containing protein n=1 Tax=Crucibulum laeve TaxID=68775 RepID=A0A5C3M8C7_9AGAR|nr:hypothetical protein BDQ12DRAFT_733035 [Crucibulum laeve]
MPLLTTYEMVVALFTASIATGLYLSTLLHCLRWLLFTDEGWKIRKKISWPFLIATLSLLVLSTIHLSLALWETLEQVLQGNQTSSSVGPIPWSDVVMCTVVNISVLITDGVLIYRCWLAYSKSRAIIIVPCIFWIGGAICTILQVYWQVIQSAVIKTAWQPVNMKIGPGTILTPFWGSTIIVNIYVTSMIVYRIWKVSKASEVNASIKDLRFAIRVLVESGALYLIVTIPHFIVWWTTNSLAIVLMGWINLPVVCSAFNLILIRIARHRAEERTVDRMASKMEGAVSEMKFDKNSNLPSHSVRTIWMCVDWSKPQFRPKSNWTPTFYSYFSIACVEMPTTKQVLEDTGLIALILLKGVAAASEAFPPLKGVTELALEITNIVSAFRSNKKQWKDFAQYVQKALACIIHNLPDAPDSRDDLKQNMIHLKDTLESISKQIKDLQQKAMVVRFWNFLGDPGNIEDMKKELDESLSLFHLNSLISSQLNIAEIRSVVDNIQHHLGRINSMLEDKVASTLVLGTLSYAEGAAWNPTRVCLPETRKALRKSIWNWITSGDLSASAEIFWLADVAGSGKSALAHAVAQHCYNNGVLASSFFFDKGTAGRNTPRRLISTLARDLCRLSKDIAEHVALALEEEPGLAVAQSISHQFQKLILEPFIRNPIHHPVVAVIDALDEGYDPELLGILCNDLPKLPGTFRLFLTSRPIEEIMAAFSKQQHVISHTIQIYEDENQHDIATYARLRLKEIAILKNMRPNWPSEQLVIKFINKAGGLFIWVSTVCEYLSHSTAPEKKLRILLADDRLTALDAEGKMTKLYSAILTACDWNDEDFVEGYNMVMGTLVASKTPLSVTALQSLHRNAEIQISEIISPLAPLLIGSTEKNEPVRLLHLSFRDFVTVHARSSENSRQFYIDEQEHSQKLALLCLTVLNEDLLAGTPGTGYLDDSASDACVIPQVKVHQVPETLWYVCRFWTEHLMQVGNPVQPEITEALQFFFANTLIRWIEICTAIDRFQKLSALRYWLKINVSAVPSLQDSSLWLRLSRCLHHLSRGLSELGRREEALESVEESVNIQHQLLDTSPELNKQFVMSLILLSCRQSDVGYREEALQTIQEAVDICRRFSDDGFKMFRPDLATSINTLSRCLSDVGRRKEALQAIHEAVERRKRLVMEDPSHEPALAMSLNILSARLSELKRNSEALQAVRLAVSLHRQLASDDPIFIPDLAMSLNTLSARLSGVGNKTEALHAAEESVKLRRQLADERPAVFIPHLAASLNALCARLSQLGRTEEALSVAEEGVSLRRSLAADRPAAFNPDLARSLNTLSARFSGLERWENALQAAQEAVDIRRELAIHRPAAFNRDVANSLDTLARCLSKLKRHDEALKAAQESVEMYRGLSDEHPEEFNSYLIGSLRTLSRYFSAVNRKAEASEVLEEAQRVK